jgi:hypothetical protein
MAVLSILGTGMFAIHAWRSAAAVLRGKSTTAAIGAALALPPVLIAALTDVDLGSAHLLCVTAPVASASALYGYHEATTLYSKKREAAVVCVGPVSKAMIAEAIDRANLALPQDLVSVEPTSDERIRGAYMSLTLWESLKYVASNYSDGPKRAQVDVRAGNVRVYGRATGGEGGDASTAWRVWTGGPYFRRC